jgi:formate-dependent nitrite reductase cytochrome c552 subunit
VNESGRFDRWAKRGVEQRLARELEEASESNRAAKLRYEDVMKSLPSGIPQPDSNLRIQQVAEALDRARVAHQKALTRWTAFVAKGTIPSDEG